MSDTRPRLIPPFPETPWPIFGCALREEIVAALHASMDPRIRAAAFALMDPLPSRLLKTERNKRIRDVVAPMVRAALPPGSSEHAIATMIAAAGRMLESDCSELHGRAFECLPPDDRMAIGSAIKAILVWAPAHEGNRWPGWRTIFNILAAR